MGYIIHDTRMFPHRKCYKITRCFLEMPHCNDRVFIRHFNKKNINKWSVHVDSSRDPFKNSSIIVDTLSIVQYNSTSSNFLDPSLALVKVTSHRFNCFCKKIKWELIISSWKIASMHLKIWKPKGIHNTLLLTFILFW